MEFVARESPGAAGKEVVTKEPEAWLGHVEDGFVAADAGGGDTAVSAAERT